MMKIGDHSIPLYYTDNHLNANIILSTDLKIPPFSEIIILYHTKKHSNTHTLAYIEGNTDSYQNFGVILAHEVVTMKDVIPIRLCNPSPDTLKIPKDIQIASIHPIQEEDIQPLEEEN